MTTQTKEYPPELKVDFDESEPAGIHGKVKVVPKKMKNGAGEWVVNPNGGTKKVVDSVNHVHVVFPFPDAYKKMTPQGLKFPTFNAGGVLTAAINWRMYVVGPIAKDADGDLVTKAPLPLEVGWQDRSTDNYMYDRMTRIIQETLAQYEGTKITDHVFEFGKKAGKSPAGAWHFRHVGLLSDHYPNVTLPERQARSEGGQSPTPRQEGPSAAVLAALPDGARLPGPTRQAVKPAQPQTVTAAPSAPVQAAPPVFSAPTTADGPFTPNEAETAIATALKTYLVKLGTPLADICSQQGRSVYDVLYGTFVAGNGPKDASGNKYKTSPERAKIIATDPTVVGLNPTLAYKA